MLVDVKPLQFLKRPFTAERFISDEQDLKRRVPLLIERSVVNVFKRTDRDSLAKSICNQLRVRLAVECRNSRRSCRVGFGQNKSFVSQALQGEYSTTFNISTITTVMCIEVFFFVYSLFKINSEFNLLNENV